jgi:predicted RNase H-like nuclease (RuvC/YqgF family)
MNPFDEYKSLEEKIDKINDKIDKINEEVRKINEKVENAMLGIGIYKEISKEDRNELIAKLETQLADLKADKEWLKKRIEEEKKSGIL